MHVSIVHIYTIAVDPLPCNKILKGGVSCDELAETHEMTFRRCRDFEEIRYILSGYTSLRPWQVELLIQKVVMVVIMAQVAGI